MSKYLEGFINLQNLGLKVSSQVMIQKNGKIK